MYHYHGETADYRAKREELLAAEIALRDQRETVAALRRALPQGPIVEDYVLQEGPRDLMAGDTPIQERRLSELIEAPDKPLVLVHFMLGKKQSEPCPMCTLAADSYAGVARQIEQRATFGAVAAAPLERFRDFARQRAWTGLRLFSAGESNLKRDFGVETEDGQQLPAVSVFLKDGEGQLRHCYTGGAVMAEGEYRGLDLIMPLWHVLDLTPQGRGDWLPSLD